jgi:hypothetical protein
MQHTVSDSDFEQDSGAAPPEVIATAPLHAVSDDDFEDKDDAPAVEAKAEPAEQDDPGDEDDAKATEAGKSLNARKSGLEKRRLSIQAQIDQSVKEREETRREAAALRAELDTLRRERDTLKPPTKADTTPATTQDADPNDPEPKEGDFESYADYVKKQARWEARQEFREQQRQAREAHQRGLHDRAQRERLASYSTRLEAARTKHADFDARIDSGPPLSPPMTDAILESEIPGDIMLYLCDYPDEADKIRALPSQVAQYGAMKKIEARVEARLTTAESGPVEATPLSSAKPLIKPVKDSHGASGADDEDPEDVDAYIAKHSPHKRQRRA